MYCDNPVPLLQDFTLSNDLISRYPCNKATKDDLRYLLESNTGPCLFKVSSISFCVIGIATTSNSVGFCHVKKVNSTFLCSSKDCTHYASKTKASKQQKNMLACSCLALHFAIFGVIQRSYCGLCRQSVCTIQPSCHCLCHQSVCDIQPCCHCLCCQSVCNIQPSRYCLCCQEK